MAKIRSILWQKISQGQKVNLYFDIYAIQIRYFFSQLYFYLLRYIDGFWLNLNFGLGFSVSVMNILWMYKRRLLNVFFQLSCLLLRMVLLWECYGYSFFSIFLSFFLSLYKIKGTLYSKGIANQAMLIIKKQNQMF